jgi:peptidoglycan/LPS O-acetylase OafA/YrhL
VHRPGYLPTLDGWRALAIISVIFFHAKNYQVGPFQSDSIGRWGRFGVELFFGISGLLICTRLLEEEKRSGQFSIRGFYIRRVMRIQPPALVMLAAVSLLMVTHTIPAGWSGVMAALFFARNYLPHPSPQSTGFFTGHFWSLAVEEHFYLLLPGFLCLCSRFRARILLAFAGADIAWATACAYVPGQEFHWGLHRTDHIIYFLVIAAAAAVLLQRISVREFAMRHLPPRVAIGITVAILAVAHDGNPMTAILPVLLLVSTVLHPTSAVSVFLESAPMRFIGRISFGLYLWQELPFTGRYLPNMRPFGFLHDFPWNFIAVLSVASASYYLIEKPCIKLGHRWAASTIDAQPAVQVISEAPSGLVEPAAIRAIS